MFVCLKKQQRSFRCHSYSGSRKYCGYKIVSGGVWSHAASMAERPQSQSKTRLFLTRETENVAVVGLSQEGSCGFS